MFRRKDENATDGSPDSADSIAMPSASGNASESANLPSSLTGASASSNPYAPSAQSYAPARPAAASGSNYRPAPLADFARNSSAGTRNEPQRSSSAATTSSAVPSFSALSDKSSQKANRRVLTVGNDILLKGEIATCDRLVIEGRVEAKLSDVHTVEIAECGSFKGTAEVEDAEISGVFEGDLIVRNRLVIYSSGEVRGNITYGEIEIERGGRLTGQIKTVAISASVQQLSKSAGAAMSAQEVKARAVSKETFAA